MARLLLINGPNLNLLGMREPSVYGPRTLADLERELVRHAAEAGVELRCFQSNAEHALIESVHAAHQDGTAFIIINPGGYTHTSIALRDALLGVAIPFIEVHISNVHAREAYRRHSYLSDVAQGVITGLGTHGYRLAIDAAVARLRDHESHIGD